MDKLILTTRLKKILPIAVIGVVIIAASILLLTMIFSDKNNRGHDRDNSIQTPVLPETPNENNTPSTGDGGSLQSPLTEEDMPNTLPADEDNEPDVPKDEESESEPPADTGTQNENPVDTGTQNENPPTAAQTAEPDADSGQSDTETSEPPHLSIDEKARNILNKMTLEEKVGQMFIARCPTTDAAQKAAKYHLGGYILFGRDFSGKTAAQVVQTIRSYQAESDIPLLIGVDEEGGTVNRVSSNPNLRSEPFPSPQELYLQGGFDAVRRDAEEKSRLLKSLGINVNFAPVCDVSTDPNDFIYKRAFGQNAEQTAIYVRTVVQTMKAQGMGSVLKHFPGYGNNSDTHTGIAYDSRPYDTFASSDFLPFEAGIQAGADMVMVCHNIVDCMDSLHPASLSPRVHEILRDTLGFDGVIVTDDLYMDGIRDFTNDEQAAVMAVQAGNDLLCCTDFETQVPAVLNAVKNGTIRESRVDQSALRILKMKISLGLLD